MKIGPRLLYERLKNIVINSVWEITDIDTDAIQNGAFSIQPILISIGDNTRLLFNNDEFIMLPYRNVTLFQNGMSIHIGTFETFVAVNDEYKYMLYSNGTIDSYCKNGRDLKVYIHCYSELLIKSITEPTKCNYSMIILLPEICGISMRVGDEFLGLETPSPLPNQKIYIPDQSPDLSPSQNPDQSPDQNPDATYQISDTPRQTYDITQSTFTYIPHSYTPQTVTPTTHIIYITPSSYNMNNTNTNMEISSSYLYSFCGIIGLVIMICCCCCRYSQRPSSSSIKYKRR